MKKINIAELLKDCPKGMELYSPIFGELKFNEVNAINNRILVVQQNDCIAEFESDGRLINCKNGECLLFPSKDQRDWSKFVPPCQFKDGDVVAGENCVCSYITIFRKFIDDTSFSHHVCLTSFGNFKVDDISDNANLRLATEEEKTKLFDAIKANGYKWNEETKTLEKLPEPKFKDGDRVVKKGDISTPVSIVRVGGKYYYHYSNTEGTIGLFPIAEQDDWELVSNKFDINTLKPFDKVLVRDKCSDVWTANFYSHYDATSDRPFVCVGWSEMNEYRYCIPYEANKELLGTTNNIE